MFQSQLTSHEKISHENKKDHDCDACEKSFSHAQNLKRLFHWQET